MSKLADQKIRIAGCGAIGSVVGCLLKQAGHDLTLLAVLQDLKPRAAHGNRRAQWLDLALWKRHWSRNTLQ